MNDNHGHIVAIGIILFLMEQVLPRLTTLAAWSVAFTMLCPGLAAKQTLSRIVPVKKYIRSYTIESVDIDQRFVLSHLIASGF